MVLLDASTGLRRGELMALKWYDLDFEKLEVSVMRSIYRSVVGKCETEASRKPVPLDPWVAEELLMWRRSAPYNQADDWIFASPRVKGKRPYQPDMILQRCIRPAAVEAGITKHIGWHTFRHTFSTMLKAGGEDIKVMQELLRHANSRITLDNLHASHESREEKSANGGRATVFSGRRREENLLMDPKGPQFYLADLVSH
jgi:integrase